MRFASVLVTALFIVVCAAPNIQATERVRIYQLFVRLFGNTNTTRKPNGTLTENGVGKFADINDAALDSLHEMGFTHLWLTGVLQQATSTSYPAINRPADDPDLLKGLAGSPYAIKDYFDVCPDYAQDPAHRLEEFVALVARIHHHGMKALIDFVPNHVARSYHSTVRPELDFGLHDDRTQFFSATNNFFYLQPGNPEKGQVPPLKLPTYDPVTGLALSPTCKVLHGACDGLFNGETEFARVTGNNEASWTPSRDSWYETIKLNYGFDFSDPTKQRGAYPGVNDTDIPIPDTWEKMDAILAYWQDKGVDGFRCDMAHMIPPEFWHWAIQRARARNTNVFFVAEAYDDDPNKVPPMGNVPPKHVMETLIEAGFDAVYDDPSYKTIKKIYEGPAWANDIDAAAKNPLIFQHSLRYAENHDEVRLAAPSQWGRVGMEVGRPVCGVLFALSRGPVMIYNGQEIGEPATGMEGFGGDDARTSIFDYWSMPQLVKWNADHTYRGNSLTAGQRNLRAFYGRLLNVCNEPAFKNGDFFPLNSANAQSDHFGKVMGDPVGGHWLYACLRYEPLSKQRMLVIINLHRTMSFEDVVIQLPLAAVSFLQLDQAPISVLDFSERLCPGLNPQLHQSERAGFIRLKLLSIPPLTPFYFEIKVHAHQD